MNIFRVLIPLTVLSSICCVACKISDDADRCSGKYTWDPIYKVCVISSPDDSGDSDDSENKDDFDAGNRADAG
jgi:hypothetical protein